MLMEMKDSRFFVFFFRLLVSLSILRRRKSYKSPLCCLWQVCVGSVAKLDTVRCVRQSQHLQIKEKSMTETMKLIRSLWKYSLPVMVTVEGQQNFKSDLILFDLFIYSNSSIQYWLVQEF